MSRCVWHRARRIRCCFFKACSRAWRRSRPRATVCSRSWARPIRPWCAARAAARTTLRGRAYASVPWVSRRRRRITPRRPTARPCWRRNGSRDTPTSQPWRKRLVNKIGLLAGPAYLLQGFRLIRRPGLRRFVLIPLMINAALFTAVNGYGFSEFHALIDTMLTPAFEWLEWLLWPLFALTVLVIAFYSVGSSANLIAAPFNSLLAAAVELGVVGESELEGLIH